MSPVSQIRHVLVKLALGLAFGAFAFQAFAGDDEALCDNSAREPIRSIPACTKLLAHEIDEGRASRHLNNRGVAKVYLEDQDGALRDFAAALDKDPSNFEAIKNSGIIKKLKGGAYLDEAIKDFSRAIRLKPKDPDLYNMRGATHLDKDDFEAAMNDFNRAIAEDPNFVNAFINRGLTYYYLRNLKKALADLDVAVRLTPKETFAYLNRAMMRIDKADFEGAIADYDKAIELDGQNAIFYTRRGEVWRLQGNLNKALADHNRSISLKPSDENYNNRALTYKDMGKLDEAKADCSEAIILNPSFPQAYINRGLIRRLQGDLGGSLVDLNKAVALAPRSPTPLVYRGDVYREMGDLARAFADFNEAVRIVPDYVATYVGRGLTYERSGDFVRARHDYEKALSLPSDKEAALAKPAQKTAKERLTALIEEDARQKLAGRQKSERFIPQDPGVRLALVIGNSDYKAVPPLYNTLRDAEAVADAFRKLGFKTVVTASNLTREEFLATLREFGKKVERADWAVIFYAGHAFSMDGDNYLIPVDAKIKSDQDVQAEVVPLEKVLVATKGATRIRLVMLDACRDNPFLKNMKRTSASHTIGNGLASIEPGDRTFVAFATRDGRTAEDGLDGDHSPFTQAFLNNLNKPGLEINMLFRKVHDEVLDTTKGRQEPFTYGSLPFQNFYFATR